MYLYRNILCSKYIGNCKLFQIRIKFKMRIMNNSVICTILFKHYYKRYISTTIVLYIK